MAVVLERIPAMRAHTRRKSRRIGRVKVWGLGLWLCLVLGPLPTAAQQRYQVHGYVQWIAGSDMQLQTDAGASILLDLSQVDQDSYRGLANGKGVTVTFVVVRSAGAGQGATFLAESVVADP